MSSNFNRVSFYGASDDSIYVKTHRQVSSCAPQGDIESDNEEQYYLGKDEHSLFKVKTLGDSRQCYVHAFYGKNGATWSFMIEMIEEDIKLPPWEFTITNSLDVEYSTCLTIDTGDDDVEIICLDLKT